MSTITLSLTQRLALDAIIGQQRGSVQTIMAFYDIAKKINNKEIDLQKYTKQLPNGTLILNEESIAKDDSLLSTTIEIEKAEIKQLVDLLNSHNSFGPGDLAWVLPLKKQLESLT